MATSTRKFIFTCLAIICLMYEGETMKRKGRKLSMIAGGEDALPTMFPFVVSLQRWVGPSQLQHHCTLTLITSKTCLGAAHCQLSVIINPPKVIIHDPNTFCGVAGLADIKDVMECKDFSKIHWHSKYSFGKKINDIATFIFKDAFNIDCEFLNENCHVLPIPIAGPEVIFNFRRLIIVGWGSEYYGQTENVPTNIKFAWLDILPTSECRNAEEKKRICLRTEGRGPCMGDTGGPNFINPGKYYVLVGITNEIDPPGICAYQRGIATDVRGYTQWIIDHSDMSPNFYT